MVAVTSFPVGFTRLPAASAAAFRHLSLPLQNKTSCFHVILINNVTQKMSTVTFKGILLFKCSHAVNGLSRFAAWYSEGFGAWYSEGFSAWHSEVFDTWHSVGFGAW